jgi:predicted transcriptional regulator
MHENAYKAVSVLTPFMPRKGPPKLWPKAIEVFNILRKKDATWTELRHETNLSGTSLRYILQMLLDRGLIFHRKVDGKYCNQISAHEGLEFELVRYTTLTEDPESFKDIVAAFRTKKDTGRFEDEVLMLNVNVMSGMIPGLVYDSLHSGRNAHQRLDDLIELFIRPQMHDLLGLSLLNKELAERVTKQMRDSNFEEVTKEFHENAKTWREFTAD